MKSEDQQAIFSSFGFTDFFGFVSLYFSRKKLVLINLNAIFPEKFINTFSIKPKKIINLFSLRSRSRRLANRKKLILPLGNYIKTLKEHNFLSNVQFFKVQNNGVKIWVFDVTRGISM